MDMSVAMLCPALSRTVESPYSPMTTTPSSHSLQVRMPNTPAPASSCSASASTAKAHDSACALNRASQAVSTGRPHVLGCSLRALLHGKSKST